MGPDFLMTKIDLVFRQIDERTRDVALALAKQHIRPDAVHIIDDVRPFTECVNQMLRIPHDCDYVVYLDADCLILEDMRGFIENCDAAYVDSYVSDRFRGRIHCGVHITRIDLVREMAAIEPPLDDMKYVLRPESRLRNLAMKPLRLSKQFRNFDILHDYFQFNRHIFQKYALRELRSRTPTQLHRLKSAMQRWKEPMDEVERMDFDIAEHAISYARQHVAKDASSAETHAFIESLPQRADEELARLGIPEKPEFTEEALNSWLLENEDRTYYGNAPSRAKVFGIGLSRTGTRSLTSALQVLGYDTSHYPIDEDTYTELSNGQYDLTLLKDHDGLTDITTVPFYPQLDKAYPGSKFILTVREKEGWLRSCQNHWFNRPAFKKTDDPDDEVHLLMRQFLRSAVFGTYAFVPDRFVWVYDQHVKQVKEYFKDRPDDLLIIDICSGEGFEKLAPFLGREEPIEPFPHKGSVLSKRVAEARKEHGIT